ncbi:MAG: aminoacyl-tRNA hydrolase [Patescibacteria group bacterium]
MKIIVGLGNPGKQYEKNRHNVGFMLLDDYVSKKNLSWSEEKKLQGEVSKHEDLVLVKPDTFMNASGDCVSKVLSYYKVGLDDLVVIHDDVDLEFGKTVFKKGSGSAGHHGVEDIILKVGSQDFWRYRVGVGRPENVDLEVSDWVLSDLSSAQLDDIRNIPFPIS